MAPGKQFIKIIWQKPACCLLTVASALARSTAFTLRLKDIFDDMALIIKYRHHHFLCNPVWIGGLRPKASRMYVTMYRTRQVEHCPSQDWTSVNGSFKLTWGHRHCMTMTKTNYGDSIFNWELHTFSSESVYMTNSESPHKKFLMHFRKIAALLKILPKILITW